MGAGQGERWTNVCVWLFSRQEDMSVDTASTFTKCISRAGRLRLRAGPCVQAGRGRGLRLHEQRPICRQRVAGRACTDLKLEQWLFPKQKMRVKVLSTQSREKGS